MGMYSMLVNPLQQENDYCVTKWKRNHEIKVLYKYLITLKKNKNENEYTHVLSVLEKRIKNIKTENTETMKLKEIIEKRVKKTKEKDKKRKKRKE